MKGKLVDRLLVVGALTVGAVGLEYGCSQNEDYTKAEVSYSVAEKSDLEREIDRIEDVDIMVGVLTKAIYEKPEEAKDYIFNHFNGSENRFKKYDFDNLSKEKIEDIENTYQGAGYDVNFPEDSSKLSESDQLAIFYVNEVNRDIASAIFPGLE